MRLLKSFVLALATLSIFFGTILGVLLLFQNYPRMAPISALVILLTLAFNLPNKKQKRWRKG
jgi:TctA family transporter